MSSASWSVPTPQPSNPGANGAGWKGVVEEWRWKWDVPRFVAVGAFDQTLTIDLDDDVHLELLREEASGKRPSRVTEVPGGEDVSNAWIEGRAGGHRCEIVVAAAPRTGDVSGASPAPMPDLTVRPVRAPGFVELGTQYPPGSEWVYARLYMSHDDGERFIVDDLGELIGSLAPAWDDWFFVRYMDPDPHIRLRIHAREPLHAIPIQLALRDMSVSLRERGYCRIMELGWYEPEYARYGGSEGLAFAHRVFTADSALVVALLQAERASEAEPNRLVTAAAAAVDLAMHLGGWDALRWLRDIPAAQINWTAYKAVAAAAKEAVRFDAGGPPPVGPLAAPAAQSALRERAASTAKYGEWVRARESVEGGTGGVNRVSASLVHMFCNRLLARGSPESTVQSVARGAADAHLRKTTDGATLPGRSR